MIETLSQLAFKPYISNKGHSDSVNSIVISPDKKYIVSASEDKTIKVWDFNSGECLSTIYGYSGLLNALTISPDGKYIIY
ncbi:hypothetical protein QT384_11210 (plasmid) [Arcobacter cryaerophilus gv. pseudocryaerophilus]|uniref:WD40 repeat domain-containing protein n=4 Tax=Arcobacteraceae TaxID=2808963 RepID=A0AA96DTY0_9BACT|nr:hypothetical protein RMP68_11210 [Arcobacter sp. AZ-2023]WNL37298.1 hypothetical protein RMQ66_11210 [Arcobacter sp. AZ-2023]WPD13014.1 hypothetical protein QT384_11210 [Arcobacter sp. DSM 115960]